jgi:signal transduction histidine kinase
MTSELKDHESKSEDAISRPNKLKVTNNSLLVSNEKLKSKIEGINQAKQDSLLLPSKQEPVSVNKKIISTNEKFATINKQVISFSEKIKQHDITQADFINIAAYELKTLTHVIIGYSELLQMDFEGDDNNSNTYNYNTAKKVLHVIVRSANELQKLINDILNISKIESQRAIVV